MLEQIQWTDMVLMAILILSSIIGLLRGFIREFFTVFNFGIAIFAAYKLPPIIVNFMKDTFDSTSLSPALLMTILFAFTMLILTKFSRPISRKYSGYFINKIIGLFFGFTRGMLIIVSIIAFGIFSLIITEKEWKRTSFINLVKPATDTFISILPEAADKKISAKVKNFDNLATVQAIKKLLNNNFDMKLVTNDDDKKSDGANKKNNTTVISDVDPAAAAVMSPEEKKLLQMQNRLYGTKRRDMNTREREILLNKQQKLQQLEQEKKLQQQKEQEKLKKKQDDKSAKSSSADASSGGKK